MALSSVRVQKSMNVNGKILTFSSFFFIILEPVELEMWGWSWFGPKSMQKNVDVVVVYLTFLDHAFRRDFFKTLFDIPFQKEKNLSEYD